jgi:hypothetical protein
VGEGGVVGLGLGAAAVGLLLGVFALVAPGSADAAVVALGVGDAPVPAGVGESLEPNGTAPCAVVVGLRPILLAPVPLVGLTVADTWLLTLDSDVGAGVTAGGVEHANSVVVARALQKPRFLADIRLQECFKTAQPAACNDPYLFLYPKRKAGDRQKDDARR